MGKNKKLKKSIESFEKRIKEHEEKIKEFEGKEDSPLINYWEKEKGRTGEKVKKIKLLSHFF
ncbi:MAG: hypothetical protein AABY06_00190 [Nanoarchaeota archaeon]